MAFADEPVEHGDRCIDCGWSVRPQTAADIAARVQQLARRLAVIDPAYGRLRPDPGMRTYRPGDLGPIVEMTTEMLEDLIDRRGRFDPPRFPAPVGQTGYRLLYRGDFKMRNPSFLSVSVRAGQYGTGWVENVVKVWPDVDHPMWRFPEIGLQVLEALVDVWDPEWACAYGAPVELRPEDNEISRSRPWLAWTAKPLQPRPNPPYARAYPYPFPLDDAGPPAEERQWHGGKLQFWP
jgi:hypothetical protein